MKKTLLTLTCLALSMQLWAQAPTNTKPIEQTPPATKSEAEAKANAGGNPGSAIGLVMSTNGVGLQFTQNIGGAKMLVARAGGMYMPFKLTNFEYDFEGTTMVLNGDIKLGAVQALFDFHPFKNAFKLTAGAAYMLSDINATGLVKDSVKQGDIMISPEEVGTLDIGIKVGPICPYVGIGFGRAVPRKRVSFNFEMGAYYITKPQLTFKATGMIEPTSSNEKVFQDNLSGYSWLPMMNFGLNFKISK